MRWLCNDHRLVAHTRLLLPTTLADHEDLGELAGSHLDRGDAIGRSNVDDKLMTLVVSILGSAADVLLTSRTAGEPGCAVRNPSTLRSFCCEHLRR